MRMKLTLSENIRSFRKERKMTQEQLATVLGVTVGAVYKWESGLSVPELDLIVEMADFFDTSVDVLLGYRMKDNHLESMVNRLYAFCQSLDPMALTEAEKALAKYPHSFRVVLACADLFLGFGSSTHDHQQLRRALELLEQARVLLPQNDNPRVSESTICGKISLAYVQLGERDKAIEILKKYNTDGMFSHDIGATLAAFMNRPEEAVPYLSETIAKVITHTTNAMLGYLFVYRSRGDWASALEITRWSASLISGLKAENAPGFLDKIHAEILLALAYTMQKSSMPESSRETLKQAAELVRRFDSTPEYSLKNIRFMEGLDHSVVFDGFGSTAAESMEYLLNLVNDRNLTDLWKEISSLEQ